MLTIVRIVLLLAAPLVSAADSLREISEQLESVLSALRRVEQRVAELGDNAAELPDVVDEDARAAPPPRPPPAPGDPYDWIPVEED